MAEVSAADRALVRGRALGRCEYCRLPESSGFVEHQIDHIIAIKHGGGSDPGNLALSCTLCNRAANGASQWGQPWGGPVWGVTH